MKGDRSQTLRIRADGRKIGGHVGRRDCDRLYEDRRGRLARLAAEAAKAELASLHGPEASGVKGHLLYLPRERRVEDGPDALIMERPTLAQKLGGPRTKWVSPWPMAA